MVPVARGSERGTRGEKERGDGAIGEERRARQRGERGVTSSSQSQLGDLLDQPWNNDAERKLKLQSVHQESFDCRSTVQT